MKITYIYALICPEENIVKYVGKTSNLQKRVDRHLSFAISHPHLKGKNEWLRSIQSKNLKLKVSILDTCTDDNWKSKEVYWISFYKLENPLLFNKTVGGEDSVFLTGNVPWNKGGGDYSDETRMKMRLGKLGKTLSDETKSNMSAASLGKPKSDSHKMNIRLGQGKKVIQMDLEGNYIQEFPATSFAAEHVSCARESIRDACKGRMKTCKGFKWKFKEQIIND